MKLAIDQAIEFSFDEFLIQRAEECINQIRGDYKQRGDDVLRAVLMLLLMGEVERQKPGTIQRLLTATQKVAEAMSDRKPDA